MDIEKLKKQKFYDNQICFHQHIDKKKADLFSVPNYISPKLKNVLLNNGIEKLYSHQKIALDYAKEKKHFVITTPTSSGKTMCFNLPVLNNIINNPKATALYLYPTKALTQDQLNKIKEFEVCENRIFSYDGDTEKDARQYIKKNANVIFTNPDMLHVGILPYHASWADFFLNLDYIIIDEFHTYKGIFASHMSSIIKRLRRICKYYKANPTFILSSATLSNPKEFTYNMTGLDFEVIDTSGAESGGKDIIFWNPPFISKEITPYSSDTQNDNSPSFNIRKSYNQEALNLIDYFIKNNLKTIAFSRSRAGVELLTRYAREMQQNKKSKSKSKNSILAYRSGYTKDDRKDIEERIFSNEISAIIATNALELGIDIGGLDISIVVGYPGNIASLWQQFGRAGRKNKDGTAILVAREDLIDQYYMNNPKDFFNKDLEKSIVNNKNEFVLYDQLSSACAELPLDTEEILEYWNTDAFNIISNLLENDLIRYNTKFYWNGKGKPSNEVNIRGTDNNLYDIILMDNLPKLLGVCDSGRIFSTLYEGAIYLHDGESYIVDRLDIDDKVAYVLPTDVDYYTIPKDTINIEDFENEEKNDFHNFELSFGMCNVKINIPMYTKKKYHTNEVLGYVPIDVPETTLHTQSVWFPICDLWVEKLNKHKFNLAGAIHALEHILIGVAPILVSCDRNDLGGVSFTSHPLSAGYPSVFIYDGYQGGIGVSCALFENKRDWFLKAHETITNCKCESGCPACIQSPKCGNNNSPLDKEGAIYLLDLILNELDNK